VGFFQAIKRPGREVNHSPPSSAKVENERSYTSIPLNAFSWCRQGEIYIYTLLLCSPTVINSLLYASQQKRASEENCVMRRAMSHDIWSSGSALALLQCH